MVTRPPTLQGVPAGALQAAALDSLPYDALVVVASLSKPPVECGEVAGAAIAAALRVDASLGKGARPAIVLPAAGVPGGRIVLGAMSSLADDTDDVRAIAEATSAAVGRAVEAGASRPLVMVSAPEGARFARALDVAALAAMASQWCPLEAREAEKNPPCAAAIGMVGLSAERAARLSAIELGRALCRDVAGTDPERMTPKRIAAVCEEAFLGSAVRVVIEQDVAEYPLLAAVGRASSAVARHRPCVVRMDYRPAGEILRTVFLVGKGVTYDTGGADLKVGGAMAGMSRDKAGAAAVAGLVRAIAALGVPRVRVVGLLGLVRNSIGEEGYVTDEVIQGRSGVRVRIGNTDAEGRLVLADLLASAKSLAQGVPDPMIFSIATLTGHVVRAYGPYTGAIGNATARSRGELDTLDALGEAWGEPIERSRVRREDYAFVAPRSAAEDVISCNSAPSVSTPRGHQFPFAFLDIASGLRGGELPYVHLDISGAAVEAMDWQYGRPTGAPIATLAAYLEQIGG